MTRIRSAFYFQCALCYLAGFAYGQFCTSLKSNTWAGFVQAVTDSSQNGLATLCPFEISGDGCPSQEEYPNGLIINDETEIYVSCDPFLYGFNTDTECIIDCPGRHITVSELSSLTLERFVLSGATNSSILVEEGGSVTVINTIFKDNVVNGEIGNGGAIYSSIHSTAKVKYSQFLRNEAVYGGAIYGSQESTVEVIESKFADNQALIAGGAYANDVYASARFENVNFNVNEASSGGALYLATYSTTQLLSNNLYKNIAFNGGAIFDGGSTNIYDSVFNENKAEDSGGAIYVDAGSSTALYRTELVNNRAGNAGPAVNNRYSTVVNAVNNTACGNYAEGTSSECNGVFVFVGRQRVRCEPFANECIAPTSQPTTSIAPTESINPTPSPTVADSSSPTSFPTSKPTVDSSSPTSSPTSKPTVDSASPTSSPTARPSSLPSLEESLVPTLASSGFPSEMFSGAPSVEDSSIPTSSPSNSPSVVSSSGPSLEESLFPTLASSGFPSEMLSGAPTLEDSGAPSVEDSSIPTSSPSNNPSVVSSHGPSLEESLVPTLASSGFPSEMFSGAPTVEDSGAPSVIHSSIPTNSPSNTPSIVSSYGPSGILSSQPTKSTGRIQTDPPTIDLSDTGSGQISSPQPSAYTVGSTPSPSTGPTWMPSASPTFRPSRPLTMSPSPNPTTPPPVFWSTKFPLPLCAGDCDADRDCEDGLVCFQRGAYEVVPGCSGGSENESQTDFCIRDPSRPTSPPDTPLPSDEPTRFVSSAPTTAQPTFGDSSTWTPSASPSQFPSDTPSLRDSTSPTISPSHLPTSRESEQPTLLDDTEIPTSASAGPTRIPSMSPTFPPSRPLTASPSPNPTNPPPVFWSTKFPLPLCAGDCDADRDCEDGLICFQRGANDAVPGCSGGRENDSKTDFCIRDPSRRTSPPATPLPSHEPTGFVSSQPTTVQPSIATQQPTTPPSEVVSVPSTKPSLRGSSSPTLQPSNQPIVEALPLSWGRRFPLNRCEGDCDADYECEGDLVCFQRGSNEEVPGCDGGAENDSRTDYCVHPGYTNRY